MKPFLKSEIESGMATRFGEAIALREKPATEFVSTGLGEIDEMTGGLPRGAISELLGPASSGCTTLLLAALRAATDRDEVFALVDANDSFDPASAASADVGLDQLLWVRCGADAECALKVVDLLLQSEASGWWRWISATSRRTRLGESPRVGGTASAARSRTRRLVCW